MYCFLIVLFEAWLYVMISIDRLVNIAYSNRFKFMNNKRYQISIGILITATNFIFDIPEIPHYWDFDQVSNDILLVNSSNATLNITKYAYECFWDDPVGIYTWAYFAMASIVPFMFMFVCSILTIRIIFKSRKQLEQLANTTGTVRSSSVVSNSAFKIKSKDIRFAIISVVLNVTFLLLNSPINALDVVNYFADFDYKLFFAISKMFFSINFALVFYVNFSLNVIFRKECIDLFRSILKTPHNNLNKKQNTNKIRTNIDISSPS